MHLWNVGEGRDVISRSNLQVSTAEFETEDLGRSISLNLQRKKKENKGKGRDSLTWTKFTHNHLLTTALLQRFESPKLHVTD